MTATHQPETKSPSRRALLAGALGGIGAWAASAIGRASPVRGTDGQPLVVGQVNLSAGQTTLGNSASNDVVMWVASNTGGGFGGGTAITGYSDHGIGVQGQNIGGVGVRGISTNSTGVWGSSTFGSGVYGNGDDAGVQGASGTGSGVSGSSSSGIGVSADSGSGIGVSGISSATNMPASFGHSWGNSTGVLGVSNGGTAAPAPKAKTGVYGYAAQDNTANGVFGESPAGRAIVGYSSSGYAGYFSGRVYSSRWYELSEITTPASPSANRARLFVRDSAGKTQLAVKFPNGTVRVLATEA